jgi:hypothetical protein
VNGGAQRSARAGENYFALRSRGHDYNTLAQAWFRAVKSPMVRQRHSADTGL